MGQVGSEERGRASDPCVPYTRIGVGFDAYPFSTTFGTLK